MRTAASHNSRADGVVQADGGGDFDDFLVAALHRAIALVQVDDVAVVVAENLHFDVLGAGNVFFEEDGGIAEGAAGFVWASSSRRARSAALCTTRMPRPPPPKAALMMRGKPISCGDLQRFAAVGDGLLRAGQGGHAEFLGQGAGGGFVAHHVEHSGRGPTKVMPASAQARANSAFSDRNP